MYLIFVEIMAAIAIQGLCACGAEPNGYKLDPYDGKYCICKKCAKAEDFKKCTGCPLWQKRDQFGWLNKSKGTRGAICAACKKKKNAKYRASRKRKRIHIAAKWKHFFNRLMEPYYKKCALWKQYAKIVLTYTRAKHKGITVPHFG